MEIIGIYKNEPLTVDPVAAVMFAVVGWAIVLLIAFYAMYRWRKGLAEVGKKP